MFVISQFFHFLTDIMPWYEPEEDIPDMIIYSYCILFVVYTVNLFFLYKLKKIGRYLFLPLCIIYLILMYHSPERLFEYEPKNYIYVLNFKAINFILDTVEAMICGAVISLIHFSSLKSEFK